MSTQSEICFYMQKKLISIDSKQKENFTSFENSLALFFVLSLVY
jgi:hypothetical protein